MNGNEDALTRKLRELRSTYLERFRERAAELRRALEAIEDGRVDEGAASLHAVLHAMRGTGNSLGFTEIGGLAAEAESMIDRATRKNGANHGEIRKALASKIGAIEAAAATAREREDAAELEEEAAQAGGPVLPEELPLVYLCDDDNVQAAVISSQVAYFGYKVETYTHTQDLIEATLSERPRAIIMDIVFPEGERGGAEALAGIKARGLDVPAIFISGRSDFEARLSAVRAGGSAFFPKPVDPMKLVSTLDELTRLRKPEPFRILIVDDEPAAADYHGAILVEAGMTVRVAADPERALDIVREFRPDLVLMDIYMPNCSGHDLAALIRQVPDFLSIPIIFLSAETDKAKQLSAMKVGADGFLTKPIQRDELVGSVSLRAERMRILRSLMTQDSLTGLFNHTTTTQMFRTALDGSRRSRLPLCFAMIDIDDFKKVNDSYGHPVGDQVIIAIARALKQRLRASDIVGRYGGEEFAIVLPDTTRDSARFLLDTLREDFSRVEFRAEGRIFTCSFSCGLASSLDYPSLETLREAADRSLYQAKGSGKNRVVIAAASRS